MHKVVKKLWLPSSPALFVGAAGGGGGGGGGVIFTPSAGAPDTIDNNFNHSLRMVCNLAGASLGQIRVKFSSSNGPLDINALALGKRTGSDSATTATPLPFLFTGSSTISVGATTVVTTDWLDHSGSFSLAGGDRVVIVADLGAGGKMYFRAGCTNVDTYYKAGAATAGDANPAGMSLSAGNGFLVAEIETQ